MEVQIIVSTDDRINGMLLTDNRTPIEKTSDTTEEGINSDSTSSSTSTAKQSKSSTTQEVKSTGIADVVLGVDRDGFVDLFIELLASIP